MTNIDSKGGPSAELKKAGHWIEFRIKDKDTGNPVKGIAVSLQYANGAPGYCSTWTSGRAHFEYIPEGPCDLLKLECRKGHELLEEKESYVMKDGDSLQSIADSESHAENEITWQDIAAINWGDGARDPHVANQHMRDVFGSTRYSFNGAMGYSPNAGVPHTLIIPKKIERKGHAIDQVHEIFVNTGQTPDQFKACSGIPSMTFAKSQSFIRPSAEKYFKKLKEIVTDNPDAKLMIFGHSNAIESAKALSERRAKSAYALLTGNADYWVTLYKVTHDKDNEDWGPKSIQVILNYLNPEAKLDLTDQLDDRTIKEIETHTTPAFENTFYVNTREPSLSVRPSRTAITGLFPARSMTALPKTAIAKGSSRISSQLTAICIS